MKIVIIGNGVSGITAARTIRENDTSATIEVYTDEKYHYYSRPMLIDFLAGRKKEDELYFYSPDWYDEKNIKVILDVSIEKIDSRAKKIISENGEHISYDKLLITAGARSNIPPIKGADKSGVFTLRCLDDAKKILEASKKSKKLAVIGGGVLGLEVANALKRDVLDVTVIEVNKYLLPRQLDREGGEILSKSIEKRGVKTIVNAVTEEIVGEDSVLFIKLKDGREVEADMVIISAGIKPNIELAANQIKTNKGIIVNEYLETTEKDIYAAGDVAEFEGMCYGIIPAGLTQSKIAAMNILKERSQKYPGTVISNTLKVTGIDLTSEGNISDEQSVQNKYVDFTKGIYRKVFLKDGKIIGHIRLGDKDNLKEISAAIKSKKTVSAEEIQKLLLS